jgi:glucan-binding YG repeat protein
MPEASYEFDEDGRMVTSQAEPKNGFYEEDGSLWYYVDGAKSYAGLIEVDGSYYYVRTSGEAVRGRSYWISKTNDLMTEGSYTFDEDGRMVVPQEPDPSEAKQGIVSEDGSLWWYVDGKRTYAGVFELDGSYYYAKTNGEVVHGQRYWISKTNGLLPEASYEFAEDGKLIQ